MAEPTTWSKLWAEMSEELNSATDARRIAEHVSGQHGAGWVKVLPQEVSLAETIRATDLMKRRLNGEPLQYVIGEWSFRHLDLHVDRRVLIPRPETEQVVTTAMGEIEKLTAPKVLDLGTGSGAIALSFVYEIENAEVWATDVSPSAMEVAQNNAKVLSESIRKRLHFRLGSWFEPLPPELKGSFDLIVTNPPYVREDEASTMSTVVTEWEPHDALFAGPDGLDAFRAILPQAVEWLKPDGVLVTEIGAEQGTAVRTLALASGFGFATVGADLARRNRWVLARKEV